MSSDNETQLKYSYKFRQEAKDLAISDDEETKAEVQSYINELLGVKGNSREKISSPV